MMLRLDQVRQNQIVNLYLSRADEYLNRLGYTEHGLRHARVVAEGVLEILQKLGYSPEVSELAGIAGYLHDIGNSISREVHAQVGALLVGQLLKDLLKPEDVVDLMTAIGNHDEETGVPANAMTAALIISDKADVHRSRVRNPHTLSFDIHDRVNYAVLESKLSVLPEKKEVILSLIVDTDIFEVMEYFEIFLSRMIMCKKAAQVLGLNFKLYINETPIT